MNIIEIKLDIKDKISKINKSFVNSFGRHNFDGLLGENIDSLEIILRKVTRSFKFYNLVSITFSGILILASILTYFKVIDFVNMNKAGLVIFFTMVFIINTFRYYKVKTNLEIKIYLLSLLERFDKL
jgi:hypothetical protein